MEKDKLVDMISGKELEDAETDEELIEQWMRENEVTKLKDFSPRSDTQQINSGRVAKNKNFHNDRIYQTGKRSGEPK